MALEDADAKMYGVCSRWCGPFIRTARSIVGKQATTGLGTSQLAGTEHNDVLPLLFATCPSLHEGTLPCQSIVRLRLSCNMAVAAHMKRSSTPRCFPSRMCTPQRLAHCFRSALGCVFSTLVSLSRERGDIWTTIHSTLMRRRWTWRSTSASKSRVRNSTLCLACYSSNLRPSGL